MSRYLPGLLIILWALYAAPAVSAVTAGEVSNELVCQCGCGLILENCNHSDCSSATPMREIVTKMVEQGDTKEQILEYFVAQYGEAVLASPPKRGINLTVWLTPFAAIAAGAALVGVLISVWVRRRCSILNLTAGDRAPEDTSVVDERYERIFEREMKEFE
jgi:cytochrome c-type biogenesis protein CcmH